MPSIKNKKKVTSHIKKSNQFENIKPIEVKCFLDENKITIQTEKQEDDITATMTTIIPPPPPPPQVKRLTSASSKKKSVTPVTDMVVSKPIRHLAILPSAKEQAKNEMIKRRINLSETFTIYDGPATTPTVSRSLDETLKINNESQIPESSCPIAIHIDLPTDDTNTCDNTTISSICELIDQPKLKQRPRSLIGRFQLPNANRASTPDHSFHPPTVHSNEIQPSEVTDKKILIEQFYTQLEKMRATFNIEPIGQETNKTRTIDNDEPAQTSNMNELQDKTVEKHVVNKTTQQNSKKQPVSKKQTTTKTTSCRIQSAPVTMATQSNTDKNHHHHRALSCKQQQRRPNEKDPTQQKRKTIPNKDKPRRSIESAPLTRIDIHGPQVTLLPHDEQECQQMYEKLQRLQPNGVCVDLNTLRRALYPPVGVSTYSSNVNNNEQTSSAFKSYRQRTEELPLSWIKNDNKPFSIYVPNEQLKTQTKSNETSLKIASDTANIDRIADQLKKHAAINYSYYTRTK